MELVEIRRTILTAVAADDYLVGQLVLKGGNALELVHQIGNRASVDLDFSIATDFNDPNNVADRLEASLKDRFDAAGYHVFDYSFSPRPSDRETGNPWGGYEVLFKLIERAKGRALKHDVDHMRRQAEEVAPGSTRRFKIEISAFEYVDDRVEADVDYYTCLVYSTEMIAAEKLRAICQQVPAYPLRKHPAPRARDFYDIYSVVTEGGVSFETADVQQLVVQMFKIKQVPLDLLGQLDSQREFHRDDWPAVVNAVNRTLRDFDFYYDFVLEEIRPLEPLWKKDPPP